MTDLPDFTDIRGVGLRQTRFYKSLDRYEKKRLLDIEELLRKDTNNELTNVEYERLAILKHFIDDIELYIKQEGIQNIPRDLLAEYGKATRSVMDILRAWREKGNKPSDSFLDMQNAYFELVGKDGSLVTVEMKKERAVDLTEYLIEEEIGSNTGDDIEIMDTDAEDAEDNDS